MTYTDIDQKFIALVRRILDRHIGVEQRISRTELLYRVRAYYPKACDRQVRDAVAQTPAISSSGVGGYWMPASRDEAAAYLAELSSRQVRIAERTRLVEAYARRIDEPVKVEQMQLLEVRA